MTWRIEIFSDRSGTYVDFLTRPIDVYLEFLKKVLRHSGTRIANRHSVRAVSSHQSVNKPKISLSLLVSI